MGVFVNQVGYLKNGVKRATICEEKSFSLKNEKGETVLSADNIELAEDASSGEMAACIDFTDIKESGKYYFETASGKSCTFEISDNVYDKLFFDTMKMFYFQRCGIALEQKYAGVYTHKACHTKDVTVYDNKSITFSCCGGWHDAGDYGRYVTAGAVAVAHLLYAYELNEKAFNVELNIPESGNGIPDILNECRYEIEWLLKMQREDGAVYHKCTSMRHADFVMPEDDLLPFVATPVSSLATADFAAVCSLASRVYAKYDKDYSVSLASAAKKAGEWLLENTNLIFNDPKDCTTGQYDDLSDADERYWAVSELYILTGDQRYMPIFNRISEMAISTTALGWSDVGGLAALAVMIDGQDKFPSSVIDFFKGRWIDEADRLVKVAEGNAFNISLRPYDFRWGSNMNVLINADVLMMSYSLTGIEKYRTVAISQIDYILGRNAVDTSYVTGHGEKAFLHPHNRPTEADGIDAPIPGYVSGGPNGNPCDEAAIRIIPKGTAPMKCYADDWGSYSTNEITIYWNSPLVFALSFLK